MAKKNDIVRYSAEEVASKLARGEDGTDWAKLDAMTEADIQAAIAADPDDIRDEPDWTLAVMGVPPPKDHINIRVDHHVLEWFRAQGKGYQTMMNNVLRAFVEARERGEHAKDRR